MSATPFDNGRPLAGPPPSPTGPARPRTGRAPTRTPILLLALVLLASVLVGVDLGRTTAPAAAAGEGKGDPRVVITGRGWGHGRGMGQYGALGYARDFGWSSARILDHYYGGTTAGQAPANGPVDPARVRVDLVAFRGAPTTVSLASGTLHLMDESGATLQRLTGAVRLTSFDSSMGVLTAPTCDGPWTPAPALARPLVRIAAETTATGTDGLLKVCGSSRTTWYAGEIWATTTTPTKPGGSPRTVNLVSVEEYLRGVIPNEVPASWPAATLQAQAVAARSYVLAGDTRWRTWADTCDTTLCQVYDGRYTNRGGFRAATDARTDAAISATTGVVRLRGTTVARTEFSSSTGGWTAGGDFPAVVDEGDAVTANPNARWQTTVSLAPIESLYRRGPLVGIAVTARNGHGADGGRVQTVELRFTNGSVTVSGDTIRRQFGLKSNWFSIGNLTRGGVVQEPIDGQLIARYTDRAYRRLAGRAPTADEVARARRIVLDGSRYELARTLVRDQAFAGALVDDLYRGTLGREGDPDGRAYWVATLGDGLAYESLGTLFYGSAEFVRRSGGTHETFVDALYRNVLHREADASGKAYWLDQLRRGTAKPDDVANAFFRSVESRRDRAMAMHQLVLGFRPGASLTDRLAQRLLTADDLTLAAELAVDIDLEDP